MTALSDRILEALADPTARAVLRRSLHEESTQTQLAANLAATQSTVSRAIASLRTLGLIGDADGRRRGSLLKVQARDELVALLLAVDRLAEAVLRIECAAQEERSASDRRLAVRDTAEHPSRRA